jgi:hypothetical protein
MHNSAGFAGTHFAREGAKAAKGEHRNAASRLRAFA